ncbi:HvfA family oxazolone/thioamide-modified RiPP metallophore [Thioalkalivibrio thiocyanodenitrificans]|jgi:uncharacterized low-complexity protein|uniref:HvfA family oxazolone/thioamide-modified RiPP metallophore n=1 Tax=Thioalkalivibrio thiocyanodenitrificans TaxID=243063 RepID=UPI00035CB334|nr:hypothetical protein [Thioalkalivibrio thiocyanodenitrificans]
MSSNIRKPLGAAALGALFVGSMAVAPMASAAENPFSMQSLSSGYTVADKHGGEGRCGEGRCGGASSDKDKDAEGKCGGDASSDKDKGSEGKCGEGRCGSN